MARKTCTHCQRPISLCFCHLIKKVANLWPIQIIQHEKETLHAIGTAKIAQLSLLNCDTQIIKDTEELTSGGRHTHEILVYPGAASLSLSELGKVDPKNLIFIDASWRKSKKIIFQSPYLQSLPRVSFNFSQGSRYQIRKEPKPGYCSTLEAIVYVLGELESNPEKYKVLLEAMDWMIAKQIEYRDSGSGTKNNITG